MIDLRRTRHEMLVEIRAATVPASPPLDDPTDPEFLDAAEARLRLLGHARDDLFPLLRLALSARFAHVPPRQLTRDLLAPLKNALGNAYKRGNERDRSKTIQVEVTATGAGALVAVTDAGRGFDVETTVGRLRGNQPYFNGHGAGLRTFERTQSIVSWESGGRTLLLCFRAPSASGAVPAFRDRNGARRAGRAMRAALAAHLRGKRLESCLVYAPPAHGDPQIRCVVRWVDGSTTGTTICTGRLFASEQDAQADFAATRSVFQSVAPKKVRIPEPVACLGRERLALYDFDPWMDLWEYVSERGDGDSTRRVGQRVGKCLEALHGSNLAFPEESWMDVVVRRRAAAEEAAARLAGPAPVRAARLERILGEFLRRAGGVDARPRVPVHGTLGWDRIHYGVDGRFYLSRLARCRRSHPGIDVGGFLADLLCYAPDPDTYRDSSHAFLDAYTGGRPLDWRPDLPAFVAGALLERASHSAGRHPAAVEALIFSCEQVLGLA